MSEIDVRDADGCRKPAIVGVFVLVSLYLALLVVTKIVYPMYHIPTSAMDPTLRPGDYVFTNRSPRLERGAIILFNYPLQPKTQFAKRIIALPGESIAIRDKQVYINRQPLTEPYAVHVDQTVYPIQPALPEPYRSRDQFGPYTVSANTYFVMGDNRDRSSDSRYWGPVPRANIRGNVILVLSPADGFHKPK